MFGITRERASPVSREISVKIVVFSVFLPGVPLRHADWLAWRFLRSPPIAALVRHDACRRTGPFPASSSPRGYGAIMNHAVLGVTPYLRLDLACRDAVLGRASFEDDEQPCPQRDFLFCGRLFLIRDREPLETVSALPNAAFGSLFPFGWCGTRRCSVSRNRACGRSRSAGRRVCRPSACPPRTGRRLPRCGACRQALGRLSTYEYCIILGQDPQLSDTLGQ